MISTRYPVPVFKFKKIHTQAIAHQTRSCAT